MSWEQYRRDLNMTGTTMKILIDLMKKQNYSSTPLLDRHLLFNGEL
jgi:hypothetical protein